MNRKNLIWQLPFLALLAIGTVLIIKQQPPFQQNEGFVFGTIYKITYQYNENLKQEIEAELKKIDYSLSPFNPKSIISAVNRNENPELDAMFTDVFNLAQHVSEETEGCFDITVAPLVNAWGFGFESSKEVSAAYIDSLRTFVGYQKVSLEDNRIIKTDCRTMLDCSSIAKGYGVDAVANLLRKKGIENFMVDIGGEVVVCGKNPKMNRWRIGINKPIEDSVSINNEIQTILEISNIGMATSGNYRNFYYKDGKRYAHTIDPRSGYPVQHSILSSTVIAKDCATADAYATAFMVMGFDAAKSYCEKHPEIQAYFICSDAESNEYVTFFTPELKKYIVNK